MKKISEGAEASIYLLRAYDCDAVLKYRQSKAYRVRRLDEMLRSRRTRIEAKALSLAHHAGVNAPRLLLVSKYGMLTTKIEGLILKELLERQNTKLVLNKAGIYLAMLHNAGIIHGDYTPANIMAKGSSVYVIDFGLALFSNAIEDKALDLLLMKRSISKKQFKDFIEGYKAHAKSSKSILERLGMIERRGRYQSRTLTTNKEQH
ncbi:MAG: KEOPS complex kinase/ATPase Bud32 [Candidatus Micrarchaeia archaeon]